MYQKFAVLAAVLLLLTACQAKPEPAEPSPVQPGPAETVSQEKPEENTPPLDTETPEAPEPETLPMEPLESAETVSAEEPKPEEGKQPPAAEKPEPPKAEQPAAGAGAQPPVTETPKEPEQKPDNLPTPSTQQEITDILREAILQKQETVQLDVSQMTWVFGADLDLRNAYYDVLNQWPELKYAYDVQFSQTDQKVNYTILYMPYQMDAYAQGIPAGAVEIHTLKDACKATEALLDDTSSQSIAITNAELQVDDLQRALLHGGYGFFVCTLNGDGTEIRVTPGIEKTLGDSAAALETTRQLAEDLVAQLVTPDMTDRQKVEAVYQWITDNVKYDWRYYQAPETMPQISTTALGALRDHVAICGGYSWAFKTMLDVCGIESYPVSGVLGSEYHAWNYVVLDGEGYYCDPTSDRGGGQYWFLRTKEELQSEGRHTWDADFYERLTADAV